jgi:hypothetical protein
MPKVLFFSDPSNNRPGLGATIQLDSGEPCMVSIAQGWVRVKKTRFGFFGAILYAEKAAYKTALTARALSFLYPKSLLPPGFTDPVLREFANAIMHCSTCAEVSIVLNEAVVKSESNPSDSKIMSDYGDFLANTKTRPDSFYDVNLLPYPKETIIAAIEREIVREPLESRVELLKTVVLWLWNFQEGVGTTPLPLTGMDLSKFPMGRTPAEMNEIRRIISDPNVERDRKRAETFKNIAEAESKKIDERIAAAVRKRSAEIEKARR